MNDRYDAGYTGDGAYGADRAGQARQPDQPDQPDQYEIAGYDEYGRPVYRRIPAPQQQQPPQQPYGGYGEQGRPDQQGYGYDPYASGGRPQPPAPGYGGPTAAGQPPAPYGSYDPYGSAEQPHGGPDGGAYAPYGPGPAAAPYDPYGAAPGPAPASYDPYGQAATSGQQPRTAEHTAYIPQQTGPEDAGDAGHAAHAADRSEQDGADYGTEQFAFVEEPSDDSEDVIDWLKFTENRTERREEARRRARSRIVSLAVVLALVAAGGAGYLWYAGKLPGVSSSGGGAATSAAAGAQKRDVIVVHLHDTAKGGTSTALLVDNTTAKRGAAVLLPNSLALSDDDGATTTLAKSVQDDGSSGTRDQLDTVLGTDIQGTWRLDTPYLQNLVDLVGNIDVDTDADVPDPDTKNTKNTKNTKKNAAGPLVHKGAQQTLSGRMAVAYATYRAPGESVNAQLERFGQVMQGVLRKISSDPSSATTTVQTLAQILDPSLTDRDLGAFLAKLADLAKGGDCKTDLLPVGADGTLSARTGQSVVKEVLGGTAKSPGRGSAVRVSVQNASGTKEDAEKARVALLGGGFTFLEAGATNAVQSASKVVYADPGDKANAAEVARTLGLPASAAAKGAVGPGADVSVVLGRDYRPSPAR
ncbi:LytR C-terminal domain-containing protein [Streptomyces sp. NPDC046985]|uniref:LCP family protein n=1 Tax=Streptomyces sp. NPDC046985 TaxID=3155377 RepID=UPI0033DECAD1